MFGQYPRAADINLFLNQVYKIEEKKKFKPLRKILAPSHPRNPDSLSYLEEKSSNARKLIKKPFFKKSTTVNFQPQVFFYYTPHVLPALKTLIFNQHYRLNYSEEIYRNKRKPNKFLAKCKHLNAFKAPTKFPSSYLKSVRKLRELKSLNIGVMDSQIARVPDLFKHLIQLQEVKLEAQAQVTYKNYRFFETGIPQQQEKQFYQKPSLSSRFFKNLFNLKNLMKLSLRIEENRVFSEYKQLLLEIFEGIGNSNIKEINIKLCLKGLENLIDPSHDLCEGVKKFFAKLDSLTVYSGLKAVSRDQSDLGTCQKNLTIVYPEIDKEIDLRAILQYSTSLKALWISSEKGSFGMLGDASSISKELKILKIKTLNSSQQAKIEAILHSLTSNLDGLKLETFDIQVMDIDEALIKKITEVSRLLDPQNIKRFSLEVMNDTSQRYMTDFNLNQKVNNLTSDSICEFTQSLAHLKNLEELKINISVGDQLSIQTFETLSSSLPKLKVLDLFLNSYDPELTNSKKGIPFCFAPEKIRELVSLRIVLPAAIFIENDEIFFERIASLKNIRSLNIDLYSLHRMKDEKIETIIKKFQDMKTFETLRDAKITNLKFQKLLLQHISNKRV